MRVPNARTPIRVPSVEVSKGKNSRKVLPQYFAYGSVSWQETSSLYESNFACYNCINGIIIALQMNTVLRLITA